MKLKFCMACITGVAVLGLGVFGAVSEGAMPVTCDAIIKTEA